MSTENSLLEIEKTDGAQDCEAVNGSLAKLVENLRQEVVKGFLDSHDRSKQNAVKALEVASFCYALIELLKEKGVITVEEVDDRKTIVSQRLVKKFADQGVGVVALQDFKEDKYTFEKEVTIDCESRVHLCGAACCRLDLALSRQDIEEGIVKWDLGRPYLIAKEADGHCRHLDRATRQCTVWRHRPIPCRGYDCRTDERIWLDFEKRIINPNLEEALRPCRKP